MTRPYAIPNHFEMIKVNGSGYEIKSQQQFPDGLIVNQAVTIGRAIASKFVTEGRKPL